MPPRLDLIDLDQPGLEGYRRFISCWLSRDGGPTFIVDPGPANTAAHLVERLEELGVDHLDYVLLTHIHLDHGGGVHLLLDAYPECRVVCHTSGHKHLLAPERLWQGSQQVLGEMADVYGQPFAIPAEALASYDDLAADGITVIETPGHAPHHISFLHQGTLFVGEASGTFLSLPDGRWYLRPATPPRFKLEVAQASLERLLALDPLPERLAFAHHGLLEGGVGELLERSRRQHGAWVETVRGVCNEQPDADFQTLADQIVGRLRAGDENFALGVELPGDILVRERSFTEQTLRGMIAYVQETG